MGDDDDNMATREQQHARWRSTYVEHAPHVRHRARVPGTDVPIEVVWGSTAILTERPATATRPFLEQACHAGDTRRARRGERCAIGIGQALQRGGIHPGERDVVDVERVADRDTGAHDGHAVRRDIVRVR